MKQLISLTALLGTAALAPTTFAQDKVLGYSVGVDAVTEYVFRGQSFGAESIQPYAEVSYGHFTAGTWVSTGVGSDSVLQGDEIDFYAGYSVPLEGDISLDIGGTYYYYPQGGALLQTKSGTAGSYEVSASVGFGAAPLSPSVTAYYDFTLEAITVEGSVGYSLPMSDSLSLDLGGTVGLVEPDGGNGYQWAQASAAISKSVTESASLYIGGNFVVNSDNNTLDFKDGYDEDSLFFFGTGLSSSF